MWAGGSCMSNTKLNTNYKDKDWRELCEYVHDVVAHQDGGQQTVELLVVVQRALDPAVGTDRDHALELGPV